MSDERDKAIAIIQEIGLIAGPMKMHVLSWAFYYAHLEYDRENAGFLSTWPIIKGACGPEPKDGGRLVLETIAMRQAKSGQAAYELMTSECAACYQGLNRAKATPDRQTTRSYGAASAGEELNFYLDDMPDEKYEAMMARSGEIAKEIDEAAREG